VSSDSVALSNAGAGELENREVGGGGLPKMIRSTWNHTSSHLDTEAIGMFRQLDDQVRVEVDSGCSTAGMELGFALVRQASSRWMYVCEEKLTGSCRS
jgi:hypothetical protein